MKDAENGEPVQTLSEGLLCAHHLSIGLMFVWLPYCYLIAAYYLGEGHHEI